MSMYYLNKILYILSDKSKRIEEIETILNCTIVGTGYYFP